MDEDPAGSQIWISAKEIQSAEIFGANKKKRSPKTTAKADNNV